MYGERLCEWCGLNGCEHAVKLDIENQTNYNK